MTTFRFVVGAALIITLNACAADPCVTLSQRAESASASRFEADALWKGAYPEEAIMAAKRREPETQQAAETVLMLCRSGLINPTLEN